MRTRRITACLFVLVGIVLFTALAVLGQGDKFSASRPRHEEAVRQVLARFEQAFEKRDAAICAGEFVDNADWENEFGSREKGQANIAKRLAGVYGMFPQPRHQITELRIRFITSVVAVVDVDSEIFGQQSAEGGTKLPSRKVRTTHVLKRKKGNWQVEVVRVADLRSP